MIGNRTWQPAYLLVYLLREIDLVNAQIQLSDALTTAFIGGIEFV
jgi:hypothetical protein